MTSKAFYRMTHTLSLTDTGYEMCSDNTLRDGAVTVLLTNQNDLN